MPNLGRYKIIRALCKVLIPFEKRQKAHKLALKTEPGRFLIILNLKTFLVWVPVKRIVVKTPFIKLKERVLLRDKTVISKNLSAGEGELINLIINNNGDNNLRKDTIPKKLINDLIIFTFNPEILEINDHGINLKVKFWEFNFVK